MKDRVHWLFSAGAFAVLGCSLTGVVPTASLSAAKPEPKPAPTMEAWQRVSATQAYNTNCAKCHGDRGQGNGSSTATLLTKEKYDQKWDKPWFDLIKKGKEDIGMDPFGETMPDEVIWAMVVHIREMQRDGLRAQGMGPKETNGVYEGKGHRYRIEDVVTGGLTTPWGLDWLPDGRMLVTNHPGSIVLAKGNELTTIRNTPTSRRMGQGGMMDVAVHPNYRQNGWIYLGFTDPSPSGNGGHTKIVRGKLDFSSGTPTWTSEQTIWQADPEHYNGSGLHFGVRIVFDGKGHIFFGLGERGDGNKAQDLSMTNGKIYRVNEDGSIPADNPFVSRSDKKYLQAIWSYGHRNPQGLVMGLDGNLYDTEHGPRGGDELNRIEKGKNYGWPVVSFSINYNDAPLSTPWPKEGQDFTLPLFRWLPSIGACGLSVVKGNAFPSWRGDLVAGGLSGQNVDRFRIKGNAIVEHEELMLGKGRVRDVVVGPDGFIYVALNQPDKVVRLIPVK